MVLLVIIRHAVLICMHIVMRLLERLLLAYLGQFRHSLQRGFGFLHQQYVFKGRIGRKEARLDNFIESYPPWLCYPFVRWIHRRSAPTSDAYFLLQRAKFGLHHHPFFPHHPSHRVQPHGGTFSLPSWNCSRKGATISSCSTRIF